METVPKYGFNLIKRLNGLYYFYEGENKLSSGYVEEDLIELKKKSLEILKGSKESEIYLKSVLILPGVRLSEEELFGLRNYIKQKRKDLEVVVIENPKKDLFLKE